MFAALIVLGNFSMSLFAPLVFASVVATMVSRSFFGIRPWYTVPPFEFTSLTQLPWFVCLGIVSGGMGAVFMKLLNRAEAAFKRVRAPIYVRLALGGLAVGLIAVWYPGVWGNGYVVTNRILQGEYGAPAFSAGDIADLESLANKLRQPARGRRSLEVSGCAARAGHREPVVELYRPARTRSCSRRWRPI